jgi:uncharacterized membrane protein (UPF0136 family)
MFAAAKAVQFDTRKDFKMQTAALISMVYGALIALGGIMGYVSKKSVASLIAGGLCGVILILCGYLLKSGQKSALPVALLITILLLGRFGSGFVKNGDWMPNGVVSILSIAALVGMVLASRGGR